MPRLPAKMTGERKSSPARAPEVHEVLRGPTEMGGDRKEVGVHEVLRRPAKMGGPEGGRIRPRYGLGAG